MNQLLQTFLIFIVGLLGGLIGSTLLGGASSEGSKDGTGSAISDGDQASLSDQLDAIQMELGSLSRRVELQASTLLTLQDRVAGAIEMDRSLREGRMPGGEPLPFAEMGPGGMADMPTGQSFDAAVDAVIQQREEEEAAARAERREQRRQEQLDQRVADLSEQLGLDASQQSAFAEALNQTSVARNDYFSDMRENGFSGREEIQAKMTELREQELETLGGFLNQDQLTQYQELTEVSGFGGFGGRGGNRGGGGSGGGGGTRGGF